MNKEFKKNASAEKIIKAFEECGTNDSVNYKHIKGSISEVGGILSKLDESGNQFFAINGKWVPAFA